MITFEEWFKSLCENYKWFSPASMHHEPKTFRDTANKVYMQYVAAEQFPPIQEARKHVYNKLVLITPDKVKIDWTKKALEETKKKQEEDFTPASDEHVKKCIAEFDEMMAKSTMMNSVPRRSYKDEDELLAIGGYRPPKALPHPVTTPEEAYVRDRHFEWIKHSFEPRIYPPQRLPNSLDEHDFNLQYDFENYDAHVKKFSVWYDQHLNGKGL